MDIEILKQLIDAYGPSGNEGEVRDLITKAIKPYVDEIGIDHFGNLVCRKKGAAPTVMLLAHMDEVGLVVKQISEKGSIAVSMLGGIEPMTIIGQRFHLNTNKGKVHGVVTTMDISDNSRIANVPVMEDLLGDTGLTKKELEKLGVSIGDYIYLEGRGCEFCNEIIVGKALDDRIGCFILIELAKRLKKNVNEILYVFTVQEEMGLYGATTSVFRIKPNWAIAVDVTNENSNDELASRFIGQGPTVVAKDANMIGNRTINNWFKIIARKHNIPIQMCVDDAGTTDAFAVLTAKGGIPSTAIGVPVRNLHSTISIAHLNDVRNCIVMLEHLLKKPPKICLV